MSEQSHIRLGAEPQKASGKVGGNPFSLLKHNGTTTSDRHGGKFALPSEFDATRFASGLYGEGQEARAMEADQPLVGTPYSAPGWSVWKYPDTQPTGKVDGQGKPVLEKHPLAGQPHKVAGLKAGENYVLMFRPLEVQQQVNAVYGSLSTQQMVQEVRGESQLAQQGDAGILTNSRLDEEIGVDRAVEEDLSEGKIRTAGIAPVRRHAQTVSR